MPLYPCALPCLAAAVITRKLGTQKTCQYHIGTKLGRHLGVQNPKEWRLETLSHRYICQIVGWVGLVEKQIEVYIAPHSHEYLTRIANPLTERFCTAALS